jgi:hypothetical protein
MTTGGLARTPPGKRTTIVSSANEPEAQPSTILAAAAAIVTDLLERTGQAIAEPVAARFRTAHHGSTGIEIRVKLDDPGKAEAIRAALIERFGGHSEVDVVDVN